MEYVGFDSQDEEREEEEEEEETEYPFFSNGINTAPREDRREEEKIERFLRKGGEVTEATRRRFSRARVEIVAAPPPPTPRRLNFVGASSVGSADEGRDRDLSTYDDSDGGDRADRSYGLASTGTAAYFINGSIRSRKRLTVKGREIFVRSPSLKFFERLLFLDLEGDEEEEEEEEEDDDDPPPMTRRLEKIETFVEEAFGPEVRSLLDQIAAACGIEDVVKKLRPTLGRSRRRRSRWARCKTFEREKARFSRYSAAHANLACFVTKRVDNDPDHAFDRMEAAGVPFSERDSVAERAQIADASLDLRVDDDLYERAKRKIFDNALPETLARFVDVSLLTVLRDSELDVWNACGGPRCKLPTRTWFSRPFESPVTGGEIKKKKLAYASLQEVVDAFRRAPASERFRKTFPEHFFDGRTFFSQLRWEEEDVQTIAALEAAIRTAEGDEDGGGGPRAERDAAVRVANEKLYAADDAFSRWKEETSKTEKLRIDLSAVDVLRLGSYDPEAANGLRIQEAADLLVARAVQIGLADVEQPKDLMSHLLFSNKTVGFDSPVSVRLGDEAVSREAFDVVQESFRRGKEIVLEKYCEYDTTRGEAGGGRASLLVRDPGYRSAFVKLCEINHQLREMRVGIVNDRRQKTLDLNREKRETLHFFQTKNGTARPINPRYA